MNWYTAKLIFRIVSGDGCHNPQFDEQLRLIKAGNEADVLKKANQLGLAGEDSFLNIAKETVKWQFIAVVEINELTSIDDGAELYYKIKEVPDADVYIANAERKAFLLSTY